MERAVRTDSTLKRKGRRPPKASHTLGPRQAGCSASQEPNVCGTSRPSNTSASPLGWAPIHSWGIALRPGQPRRNGGTRGWRDRGTAGRPHLGVWPLGLDACRRVPAGHQLCHGATQPALPPGVVPHRATQREDCRTRGTAVTAAAATRVRPPGTHRPALTSRLRHVRCRRVLPERRPLGRSQHAPPPPVAS